MEKSKCAYYQQFLCLVILKSWVFVSILYWFNWILIFLWLKSSFELLFIISILIYRLIWFVEKTYNFVEIELLIKHEIFFPVLHTLKIEKVTAFYELLAVPFFEQLEFKYIHKWWNENNYSFKNNSDFFVEMSIILFWYFLYYENFDNLVHT